jgi:hypothetical protein
VLGATRLALEQAGVCNVQYARQGGFKSCVCQVTGVAERGMGQARQALGQASSNLEDVAEELQTSGPAAPFAATPLTSMPATAGEGADKARARGMTLGPWGVANGAIVKPLSAHEVRLNSLLHHAAVVQVVRAVGHPLLNTIS